MSTQMRDGFEGYYGVHGTWWKRMWALASPVHFQLFVKEFTGCASPAEYSLFQGHAMWINRAMPITRRASHYRNVMLYDSRYEPATPEEQYAERLTALNRMTLQQTPPLRFESTLDARDYLTFQRLYPLYGESIQRTCSTCGVVPGERCKHIGFKTTPTYNRAPHPKRRYRG